MEAISQVVLRNMERLEVAPLLLINPPRDALCNKLAAENRPVRISTQDYGDFKWLGAEGASIAFEPSPQPDETVRNIILRLPREKERLVLLLHAAATRMPAARLWLVGEKRAGIRSAPRLLEQFFQVVEKLDSARHCSLFEARGPQDVVPFDLDDYAVNWSIQHAGKELKLVTLPGVFAHGRLDKGSRDLLGVLENIRPGGKILDFGCGGGVIGLSVLMAGTDAELTLLDASSLAIEASRRTLAANGLEACLLPSDGLSEVTGRFDWIISNPPFHRGVANDLDIAADFFRRSGTFLAEKGRILVVFNRHLPYSGWLRKYFKRVDCFASGREFTIIQASEPK